MRHVESHLQQASVNYFRLRYPQYRYNYFSVPNGVATSASQGRILKAEGMVAGVADTLLLVPRQGYHALCIEFKQDTITYKAGKAHKVRTYQSPEQREFQAAVEAQGYRYEVVRTLEEFISLVGSYLNEKEETHI